MKTTEAIAISKFIDNQFPSNKHKGVKFYLVSNLSKVKKMLKIKDNELIKILNTEEGLYELKLEKRTIESHYLISYILMSFEVDLKNVLKDFEDKERLMIIDNFMEVVEFKLLHESERMIERKHMELRTMLGDKFKIIRISQIHSYFREDLLMYKCVGRSKWDYYTEFERDALLEDTLLLSKYEMNFLLKKYLSVLRFDRNLILEKSKGGAYSLGKVKLNFSEMFKYPDYFNHVVSFLVSENWVSNETMKWHSLSAATLSEFVMFIKYLKIEGYFKDEIILSNKAIKDLLVDDLGIPKIHISSIEHSKPSKTTFPKLGPANKIPLFSSES